MRRTEQDEYNEMNQISCKVIHRKRCIEWDAYIWMNEIGYKELETYNKMHRMWCIEWDANKYDV